MPFVWMHTDGEMNWVIENVWSELFREARFTMEVDRFPIQQKQETLCNQVAHCNISCAQCLMTSFLSRLIYILNVRCISIICEKWLFTDSFISKNHMWLRNPFVYSQPRTSSLYIYYTSVKGGRQFTKAIHCGPILSILDRNDSYVTQLPIVLSYHFDDCRRELISQANNPLSPVGKTKRYIAGCKMLKLLIGDFMLICRMVYKDLILLRHLYVQRYSWVVDGLMVGGWMGGSIYWSICLLFINIKHNMENM